ncbi:unnamed protein product [Vitrella brassicaformis CCMP3155]|uniref:Uncharacterized protein n=1 Tax=Vitrella brassicaformis (strain CCMP3155) TaxID=1169540 RepID=A0A0G4F125_VITBC|nr:unnamed protein product [Vitrella brassicaformis CCMP3155]|eukprot:CEM05224.1 unnamed protein product [Vitrella brassicaformis CCMP3155]
MESSVHTAILSKTSFALFSGTVKDREYDIKDIRLPLETFGLDKCFGIRLFEGFADLICAPNRRTRNVWMNALSEEVLCFKTGVKGSLPLEPGPVLEAEATGVEQPSGVNIHVEENLEGEPNIKLDGINITQLAQAAAKGELDDSEPKQTRRQKLIATEKLEDLDLRKLGAEGLKSKERMAAAAVREALAERGAVKLQQAPQFGYARLTSPANTAA